MDRYPLLPAPSPIYVSTTGIKLAISIHHQQSQHFTVTTTMPHHTTVATPLDLRGVPRGHLCGSAAVGRQRILPQVRHRRRDQPAGHLLLR